jgi:Tol biopolymer transport system component
MELPVGTRLGSYEVTALIGTGGMGDVYLARDMRLGRDVAIKTLSGSCARDPDRLARFKREAQLMAALNHPNVGAIYGVEDAGGTPALVLELVEGFTLHEVIHDRGGRSRQLPLEEAIGIARQITEALDAAHLKGIIHRDLKPANVKITPGGIVKVLDFGLGRRTESAAEADRSRDPTLTSGSTEAGTVLGTPAYMSPEQARGGAVDRQTDVWAFGCLLFEMITGAQAFGADTLSDTLVHVISRDPDWTCLPPSTPLAVRRLLRRCLQKDPRRRLRDIGDARLELDEVSEAVDSPAAVSSCGRALHDLHLLRLTDSTGMVGSPAVSPDGKMVAFVAVAGGRRQIWIRLLAGGAPLQVTRDDADHDEPRWMPDSSALVYYAPVAGAVGGHLWQVSALGGPPRRIAAAMGGGDVSHDGRRLSYFQQRGDGIALVLATLDGSVTKDVLVVPQEYWCDRPRWSPDDHLLAFQRAGILFDTHLEILDSMGGEPRVVMRAGWMRGHSWLPDGSGLVYSSSTSSTMAYPPTNNLRVIGRDGSNDRQLTFGDISYFEPDVDASGRLLASREHSRSDVWRFPIDGTALGNVREAVRITRQTGQIQVPSVSPDGREMVYVSDSGGHSNLWLAAIDGSSIQQLTFERDPGVSIGLPLWAPDGERILFPRAHDARIDLCLVGHDGGAIHTLVPAAFAPFWSADGKAVYFCPRIGRIDRLDLATGAIVPVRSEGAVGPTVPPGGGVLFFARLPDLSGGARGESEVCRAMPDDGPAEVLARVPNSRVPLAPRLLLHVNVSPNGRWLAAPLIDSTTVNIWLIPTDGGPMRAATDFGERSVFIGRHVSWSPDSRHIYAAVADTSAEIVLLEGLLGSIGTSSPIS